MGISPGEFESWCFRNGGETYERDERPGIVCRFPDADTDEHVGYFSDVGALLLLADGSFFRTRAGFQDVDSWVDGDDRLHIDTDDARAIVDPRR